MVIAVALFIAAPLSDHDSSDHSVVTQVRSDRHDREHALAVQALRELEFDRAMGKLDADDYHALRQRLENRALAAMGVWQRTTTPSSPDSSVGVSPPSQSFAAARIANVNFCVECGTRLSQTRNFCPNCGAGRALTPQVSR